MAQKYGLIIDTTRNDGCGSDLLSIADELTGNHNAPCDSEIPEGMAAIWMNTKEVEQGQGSKIKMDYIAKSWPIQGEKNFDEIVFDDPTMQFKYGDLDDENSEVAKFIAENADELTEVTPEGSEYKVFMYKMPKPFIAGEVITADGECAAGVKVTLTCKKTGNTQEKTTDFLGDFEFARLVKDGEYTVQIEGTEAIEVKLDEAKNLGTIKLS